MLHSAGSTQAQAPGGSPSLCYQVSLRHRSQKSPRVRSQSWYHRSVVFTPTSNIWVKSCLEHEHSTVSSEAPMHVGEDTSQVSHCSVSQVALLSHHTAPQVPSPHAFFELEQPAQGHRASTQAGLKLQAWLGSCLHRTWQHKEPCATLQGWVASPRMCTVPARDSNITTTASRQTGSSQWEATPLPFPSSGDLLLWLFSLNKSTNSRLLLSGLERM